MKKIILLEISGWILIGILMFIHYIYIEKIHILYSGLTGYITNILSLIAIGLLVATNLFNYTEPNKKI